MSRTAGAVQRTAQADVQPATQPAMQPTPGAAHGLAGAWSTPWVGSWQLRLLGGFVLDDGQQQITRLRSRAATALLARLALAPERAHPRDGLAALLWPDAPTSLARTRLRQTLSLLKVLLEPPGSPPVLTADRNAVRVAPNALWCDARAFEKAARAGRHAEAHSLYLGELLPGFYDEWLHAERLYLQGLAERVSARLGDAQPAASAPPTPASTLRARLLRLPQYPTRLIGADLNGARLRDLVAANRLVTLVGPGGSGKTRLAVDVAALLCQGGLQGTAAAFERASFVSLVGCAGADAMVDQILLSLNVAGSTQPLNKLTQALDGQSVLMLLDNAEELDGEAVQQLAALAQRVPQVHWLVTSRRPLGLNHERVFRLSPLQPPPAQASLAEAAMNPAVALFIDRARTHQSEFHITANNREALIALLHWLGGLPLAIELAAARVRTLGPAQILGLLEGARTDPRAGTAALAWMAPRRPRRGADPRHASMLSVVAWSWNLLPLALQDTLELASAWPAGVDAEAAAGLHGAGLSVDEARARLDALVTHSVAQARVGQDGRPRYQALEPVRQFVLGRLSDDQARALRTRLRGWMLQWAQALDVTPPLATLRDELPNVMAVLAAAVDDGHGEDAVRLLLRLQPAWGEIAIPAGALTLLDRLLDAPGLDASLAAGGHSLAAMSCSDAGLREAARRHAELALRQPIPDESVRATVLQRVARIRWRVDRDAPAARALVAQALPLAQAHDRYATQSALLSLEAHMAVSIERDAARASVLNAESLALAQRGGNAHFINAARYNQAVGLVLGGTPALALPALQALAVEARERHDWDLLAGALDVTGTALLALRRWDGAAQALRDSLAVAWAAMEQRAVIYALWNIAPVLARLRLPALAAQTMGFAEACWLRHFGEMDDSDRRDIRRVRRFVRTLLGEAALTAAWTLGSQRTLAQAVQAVLSGLPNPAPPVA